MSGDIRTEGRLQRPCLHGRPHPNRHDLAQLCLDSVRSAAPARRADRKCKPLIKLRVSQLYRALVGSEFPCGRLTYRQTRQAGRKTFHEIAAAQQTMVFPGTGRGGEGDSSRKVVGLKDGPQRRRRATSLQDALGIWAAIGLSHLVRSASSCG